MADAMPWNSEGDEAPDELSTTDLEQAYLRALEAMESAEWAVPIEDSSTDAEVEADIEPDPPAIPSPDILAAGVEIASHDSSGGTTGNEAVEHHQNDHAIGGRDSVRTSSAAHSLQASGSPGALPSHVAVGSDLSGSMTTAVVKAPQQAVDESVVPTRIIEACLFVGGHPWTAKKLAGVLEGNADPSHIDLLIDELNHEYSAQGRPYEIRLGDGGYKLTLRPEFESIRSRVYGVGPRDVKLSQDVLEVLALVAYQQPITAAEVEAAKPNSANLLRQLLRRELIALSRIDETRKGVEYHTTPRFLQLFGLGQLSELPRPEDLSVR